MDTISKREFMLRQPSFPKEHPSDEYYLSVARSLQKVMREADPDGLYSDGLVTQAALNFAGYFQDIVADAGVWRSFITGCRELYGYTVPFHEVSDSYVDFELNREDVRFLTWYFFAMLSEIHRGDYPLDPALLRVADAVFDFLDSKYEDAPLPEDYNIGYGLEFTDPADREKILELGRWLFSNCWLLTPAFSMDLAAILDSPEVKGKDGDVALVKKLEEAMLEYPTGPLALFTPEWVSLMLEGKLPPMEPEPAPAPHKFYTAFVKATGGEEIKFFKSYEELNDFLIEGLGWEPGKRHLDMAADSRDFILLVNRDKGMLLARDVARCIDAPQNPCYDKAYAREHAFECLAMRGRCPADLAKFAAKRGWLPDAAFPDTEDTALVAKNRDFIMRCYLQLFYRD